MKISLKNFNPNKLMDEFISYGIYPNINSDLRYGEFVADNLIMELDDGVDVEQINMIISNHNPKPAPPQPTTEDFNLEMDYRVTMLEIMGGM